MRFGQLEMSSLFLFVGLLVVFYVWTIRRRKKLLENFAQKNLISDLVFNLNVHSHLVKNILLAGVFIFSVLALMRPQWGFKWQDIKKEGVDILLVVDVSKSMLTEDIKPNRLERTKLAVKDLVKRLRGDRIGLIAFAGTAFMTCPLTVDYSGFLLALDDLDTHVIPRPGTDIAVALKEVIKGYDRAKNKYKAAVIITDGENFEGDPLAVAKEAKARGILLYTIGVGTKDGELVRTRNDQGEYEFLKDKNGNFVKSRLEENTLQQIALTTGGVYVRASGVEFGLDFIYKNHLSQMEKSEFKSKMEKRYTERFQYPLGIALVLLIAESLITTRKRM